jgi:hypothetical protein
VTWKDYENLSNPGEYYTVIIQSIVPIKNSAAADLCKMLLIWHAIPDI